MRSPIVNPYVLVSYRPGWKQTLCRTAFRTALCGAGFAILVLLGAPGWLLVLAPTVAVAALVAGLVLHRSLGVVADEEGLRPTTGPRRLHVPWARIADIRAERRRGATVPVVYWDSGAVWRLRAPYDGVGCARDPEFEQKIFALRNLWETRRAWVRAE